MTVSIGLGRVTQNGLMDNSELNPALVRIVLGADQSQGRGDGPKAVTS